MLKKIILVVISLVAAGALGYYLANLVRDRATSPEALPETVLAFISEHFQDEKIAFAKEDRDLFKLTYEVVLTDGTKLEFRRNGDWKEIKRHRVGIPEGIVPQEAAAKVMNFIRILSLPRPSMMTKIWNWNWTMVWN